MKRAFLREHGKGVFDLIEEAFHLLRSASPATLAAYYLGAVPFVAGFLVFWTDMSSSPLASRHLGAATLGLTGLFLWMKFFQARFARGLLAELSDEPATEGGFRRGVQQLTTQTVIHSTGLFVLPLAALIVLPFGWVYAFYQNATILGGDDDLHTVARKAARQAGFWPGQNHILLVVLSGFGLYVFINWLSFGFVVPHLLEMLFGIETLFTRSPYSLLNTTFFAAALGLTYLSVDPLVKACYVLRCFQGLSLNTGEDLRTELRRFALPLPAVVCALLLLGLVPLRADETPTPPPSVESAELDHTINEVIQQGKYAWRMPRDEAEDAGGEGLFSGFLNAISKAIEDTVRWVGDLLREFLEWLFDRKKRSPSDPSASWITPQLGLLFAVLAATACLMAIVILRMIQARRKSETVTSTALAALPDLTDENTGAGELPDDEWTRLGRSLWERGDLRLALRAFYLASLSQLAARGMITLVRSKSNRDYEREIRRRAHALPEIAAVFGENVRTFDRVWYGLHEANAEVLERFLANLERMRTVP